MVGGWYCWFNLRLDGITSEKWSIIECEGQGVVCGYLRLQGGSPYMCRLRTASF
jgi:hypothetical protein